MFQLVLQFRPWASKRFDNLVSMEDQLQAILDRSATVDGHDLGPDEENIFVHCGEPAAVFDRWLPVIEKAGLLPVLSAAYRPLDGQAYTRVWPMGSNAPFDVK